MAVKIGELLIQEGLITQAELEEALKSQVIFGGRLGTHLIEMGLLKEDDLAGALSRKLKVPCISANQLKDIPPPVISCLPRELAERYRVVPLRLENRRLTLVMADPSDLRTIDELSFRTGYLIRPVIASELGLGLALEKYYQIPRELRYINFRQEARTGSPPSPPELPAAETPPVDLTFDLPEIEILVEAAPPATPVAPAQAPAQPAQLTLETVAGKLARANDREDIAEAAISWLGSQFHRGALFLVRGEIASGWRAITAGRQVDGFAGVRIPLSEPSVLKTVSEGRSPVLGPLLRTPFNSLLLQELGGEIPKTVLLLPLLMLGRITAILYLDGAESDLREKVPDLQQLTAKMVMAFEILILKNKIMML